QDDRCAQDAALVRPAGDRGQDLPDLCGRWPHLGLRAGPRPVPGRPARVAGSAGGIGVASTDRGRPLMPTVTELQLYAVDLPFKVVFRHAAAARTSSESLFLRARLDNGVEGWGEALPRAYVSGEGREQAFALLRDTILPALVGQSFRSLPEAVSFLEKCDGKAPPEWVHPEVPQTAAWCSV